MLRFQLGITATCLNCRTPKFRKLTTLKLYQVSGMYLLWICCARNSHPNFLLHACYKYHLRTALNKTQITQITRDFDISMTVILNDTHSHRRTSALVNSVQKFIEMQGWLLWRFSCLHIQLSCFNPIIVQMSEKHDSSNRW